MSKVLVINAGSSSIKYQLFDVQSETSLYGGVLEGVGEKVSLHRWRQFKNGNVIEEQEEWHIRDHREGFERVFQNLVESKTISTLSALTAIGHRVVHGGELFKESLVITTAVVDKIRKLVPLAPLHNPANIIGIEIAMLHAPNIPHVAVFDTAYHQSIPEHAYHYALPYELYTQLGVRRYGFHGTSHKYVAKRAADYLNQPLTSMKLISLHLGNGASVAAIEHGKSIDTSMGMTPLEGLMMGTRCGDIDPAIPAYLSRTLAMNNEQIESMFNTESGLKGIAGSNDMRDIHRLAETGNKKAQLALDMYCYRIKKYIGAYFAALGTVDAIIFTGGVGENDNWVREKCCEGLCALGIQIDLEKNRQKRHDIFDFQSKAAGVKLLVIPTNEELEIALQTVNCIK